MLNVNLPRLFIYQRLLFVDESRLWDRITEFFTAPKVEARDDEDENVFKNTIFPMKIENYIWDHHFRISIFCERFFHSQIQIDEE